MCRLSVFCRLSAVDVRCGKMVGRTGIIIARLIIPVSRLLSCNISARKTFTFGVKQIWRRKMCFQLIGRRRPYLRNDER